MKNYKMKKRIVSLLTVLAMMLVMMPAMAFADSAGSAAVDVTICKEGSLVMTQETVTVTDIDGDGALTINDALYAAHEAAYEGGAAAGYASADSQWGLSITKLWGDTSGSYGYYVNDASAWSLADPVKDGDSVYAFVYQDQAAWSDAYYFFGEAAVAVSEGEAAALTLNKAGYDAAWNPVNLPVAGATVVLTDTKDAAKTYTAVTDADGKAVFNDVTVGDYTASVKASADAYFCMPYAAVSVFSMEMKDVYITVAVEGDIVCAYENFAVGDMDKDGAFTINDALIAVHDVNCPGGYESAQSDWGLSITKLWNNTSGAFGYYVNDASAWSLVDPIVDGDHVYAFVYTDQLYWSDAYSYFDKTTVDAACGEEITLTLNKLVYDANWNQVPEVVAGATITVDGEATDVVTDENGQAVIVINEEDNHVISAVGPEGTTLVPPICIASVWGDDADDEGYYEDGEGAQGDDEDAAQNDDAAADEKTDSETQTGDDFNVALYGIVAVAALAAAAFCLRRKTCK